MAVDVKADVGVSSGSTVGVRASVGDGVGVSVVSGVEVSVGPTAGVSLAASVTADASAADLAKLYTKQNTWQETMLAVRANLAADEEAQDLAPELWKLLEKDFPLHSKWMRHYSGKRRYANNYRQY